MASASLPFSGQLRMVSFVVFVMAIICRSNVPALEEVSRSVDALVNESDSEIMRSASVHSFDQPRRATPTIPPGFETSAHPLQKEVASRPQSRAAAPPATAPVLPAVSTIPLRASTPLKNESLTAEGLQHSPSGAVVPKISTEVKPQLAPRASNTEEKSTDNKKSPAMTAAPAESQPPVSENRSTIAPAVATPSKPQLKSKKDEKQPLVDKTNDTKTEDQRPTAKQQEGRPAAAEPKAAARPNAKSSQHGIAEAPEKEDITPSKPTNGSSKRQHPGKLDINAATQSTVKEHVSNSAKVETPAARGAGLTATPPALSRPTTPATVSTGSPIKRTTAPRTIRVLPTPTPKTEAPPPLSSASAHQAPLPAVAPTKLPSRQPSIASVNLPGTPASELISDNASVTSASVSRASSPPPMVGGRIGSAPIRKKTKSQAKKDRQERAKQIQEEKELAETAQTPVEEEVVHAPILGRKKKTKRPATSRGATATNTPAASRPASPEPKEKNNGKAEATDKATAEPPMPAAAKDASKKESPAKQDPPAPAEEKERPIEKPVQTAASILTSLQASGELLAAALESMFKTPVTGVSQSSPQRRPSGPPGRDNNAHSANSSLPPGSLEPLPPLSEADLAKLSSGHPVRINEKGPQSSRTLITPSGKILRALSEEEENRLLELERSIKASIHDIGHFNPSSRSDPLNTALAKASCDSRGFGAAVESLASALGDAALGVAEIAKRREHAPLSNATLEQQASKAFEDDAMAYVNQFVLPTLPSQAPPTSSVRADNPVLQPAGNANGGYHAPPAADDGSGPGAYLDQAGFGLQVSVTGHGNGHGRGGPVLTIAEAEAALASSRKEAEKLEKQLNALIKKNRRLAFGGH